MLLTTQEEQLKRWEEHFSEIFNKDDNSVGTKQEKRNVEEENSEVSLVTVKEWKSSRFR